MLILNEVIEVIKRNDGDIGDTLKVLDQMILIYSILRMASKDYDELMKELINLKVKFQMELSEYKIDQVKSHECKVGKSNN